MPATEKLMDERFLITFGGLVQAESSTRSLPKRAAIFIYSCSAALTPEAVVDRAAYELHLRFAELGNPSPYTGHAHGDEIVKIDDARPLHSILDVELYIGCDATNRGCNGSDGDLREVLDGCLSRQQQNWPSLVGTAKLIKSDLAAL